MMFDFKDIHKLDIYIQKLSPNNYKFGTKKIYAKVVNGILLIKVGGGFVDIEDFYANYGVQETVKWHRHLESMKQASDTTNDDPKTKRKAATFLPVSKNKDKDSEVNTSKSVTSPASRNTKSQAKIKPTDSTYQGNDSSNKSDPEIEHSISDPPDFSSSITGTSRISTGKA
jgi:hypothetical protein